MDATGSLLLGEIFRRNAELLGEAPAAWLEQAQLSHAALDARANRLAHVLRDAGVRHGDRVAVWSDTCLEVLPLFVACARLGAVYAPVNARLGADEAASVFELARPSLIVADAAHADAAPNGTVPVASLDGRAAGVDLASAATDGEAAAIHEPALRETDPHVLFFTSGSTGRPKGVVLSHRASWLRSFQGPFRDKPERTVCMFPLFHMAPFSLGLAAWQTRGSIAFVHSPTPEALLSACERIRANRLYGIPLVWSRILEHDTSQYDLSSLEELDTGTSAVPIELVRALKERFPGTRTRIYYGSTEVGSAATLPDEDVLRKPGSVGPATPGADLAIAPDGEILVRGPYLCDGYFENEAANAAAFKDGWFQTGDLGELDADGYLSVVGRKKEILRTGGESVAPSEVEAVLQNAPGVADVAIVGLADPDWGEKIVAVVVPMAGATVTLDGLQAHCERALAGFKKPRALFLQDSLPRTPATGQVQRSLLVEQIRSGAAGSS